MKGKKTTSVDLPSTASNHRQENSSAVPVTLLPSFMSLFSPRKAALQPEPVQNLPSEHHTGQCGRREDQDHDSKQEKWRIYPGFMDKDDSKQKIKTWGGLKTFAQCCVASEVCFCSSAPKPHSIQRPEDVWFPFSHVKDVLPLHCSAPELQARVLPTRPQETMIFLTLAKTPRLSVNPN